MIWNVCVGIALGYMNVIVINDLLVDSFLVHVVMVDSHVVLVASGPVGHGAETKDISVDSPSGRARRDGNPIAYTRVYRSGCILYSCYLY